MHLEHLPPTCKETKDTAKSQERLDSSEPCDVQPSSAVKQRAGRGRGPQKASRNFVSESGRFRVQILEEDKRATTNVQNGLVFFFLFSLKKALILRNVLGGNFWKSVEKCQKVWKSAETILPVSCCPLVFLGRFPYDSYGKNRAQFRPFLGEGFWGNIQRPYCWLG